MKKIVFIMTAVIMMAGCLVAASSVPSYSQEYEYASPPPDPYSEPWVGPDTPWVYYNGDWFLDGVLYYFYGPYGWAPYYSYPPALIVRSDIWYGPKWLTWYDGRPQYWEFFRGRYPYWATHREGQRYDQKFYEQHHAGKGGGWQKGPQHAPEELPRHEERPAPAQMIPPERKQPPVQQGQQPQQHPQVQQGQQPQQHPQVQQQRPAQHEPQPKDQHQKQHEGENK